MKKIFNFFSSHLLSWRRALSFCPFCLSSASLTLKNPSCPNCAQHIPETFFEIPLKLITFHGFDKKDFYELFLQKSLCQGHLMEKHLDLTPLSFHEHLYLLSSLKRKNAPLCHIRFLKEESLDLSPFTCVFFYRLQREESLEKISHFQEFLDKAQEKFSRFSLWRKKPLFILNLTPLEDILLNIPDFFSHIATQENPSHFSFFSAYVRSTFALWYGKRLLDLLEKTFPSLWYTSFPLSQDMSVSPSLKRAPFDWILEKWGYLPSQIKPFFFVYSLFNKISSSKKTSSSLQQHSKLPPTLKY